MKLHNTLTRQTEELETLEPHKVRLYTCGLTVYSQPHIGNWVAYIYWDTLARTLRASGYEVNHVQNITDVGHLTSDEDAGEDKMLSTALKEGITAWDVAEKYIRIADHEAFELLGLQRPTNMPRATDFIQQQIEFIKTLEQKNFTYVIADGVYFDTSRLDDYGTLAKLDIGGLQFGARVADTGKNNPTDFALWKFSNPSEKRDMEWDSPWGKGFPGWHIECSAMALELLGEQIDIHTGGIDHIPVHHTNEIAQTEAVTSKQFSRMWIHANHIKIDGTKMSKSLGNVYTLQDIQDKGYDIRAYKLLVLSKHYRTEGNFTWEILDAAQNRLKNWQAQADLRWQTEPDLKDLNLLPYLQNDLDTPGALAMIDKFLEKGNAIHTKNLEQIRDLLGIDLILDDISDSLKDLISKREVARQNQEWAESDKLRDELLTNGISVRDTSDGAIWSRV